MATNKECFEHGEHNEEACELLALSQKFPDWTITTAFYASLHFVSSKIFPFNYVAAKGQKAIPFNDIESWQKFKNYASNKRHELLKDLVEVHCNSMSAEYEWLLSTSWNARYHNYKHDPVIVNLAITYMRRIKKNCTPSTSKTSPKPASKPSN